MLNSKSAYRKFCEESNRPLIFQTPLWLDAIVGNENWDVILIYQGNQISGAMPYVTSSKFGLKQITLPLLTFYLGPIIIYPNDLKAENKLSFKRKVISSIVDKIPKSDRFITHTDFEFDYWLPFYWKGYDQTTRYTYTLETRKSLDEIYADFKPAAKKAITKSKEHFKLRIGESPSKVYDLYQQDYHRKQLEVSFNLSDIQRIDSALQPSNRIILEAVNSNNEVIAAYYLVLDKSFVHYIFGAVNEGFRDSGVMSLLMFEAISEAKSRNLAFNFGGSMNKNIERFFGNFKGDLTPYMRISKVNNKWLKHFTHFNHK